jgi:Transposase IS200 like
MAIARAHLVNPALARWYHCVTRCVRRAFLLGEGQDNRKVWIEQRLQELAQIFAVTIGGFAVMDNHVHLVLRIDPGAAKDWPDEEVVRWWGRLFPPRDQSRRPLLVSDGWVQGRLKDAPWVTRTRERLRSLSWFMKCLKEPLARLANRQDNARGAFFERRFKSVAILDEESLRAVCAYIEPNPVAAESRRSRRQARTHRFKRGSCTWRQRAEFPTWRRPSSVAGSRASACLEASLWLCPIENRRLLDSRREGMVAGFPVGSYALLVVYTGRLFRERRLAISRELAAILDRLATTAESWWSRLTKLSQGRFFGRVLAATRDGLQEFADRLGVRRLDNPARCTVR